MRGNIPSFIFISDGKLHDVNILDQLVPEPGAIYVMDRGYIDFDRLGRFHETGSFFVIRPGNAACGWQVWRHHVQLLITYVVEKGKPPASPLANADAERLVDHVPQGHWKTITFVAALGRHGMRASQTIDGSMFLVCIENQILQYR